MRHDDERRVSHAESPDVVVESEDTDPSIPEPQQSAPDHDGGGRGLMLVDRLSDVWGRFRTVLGKVTWAEFDRDKRKRIASDPPPGSS